MTYSASDIALNSMPTGLNAAGMEITESKLDKILHLSKWCPCSDLCFQWRPIQSPHLLRNKN